MAFGTAAEDFITKVGMEGVATYTQNQKAIAAGWKLVSGDVAGASKSLGSMAVAGAGYAVVALGLGAALLKSVDAAAESERVHSKFNVAMKNNLALTGAMADELYNYARSLSAVSGKSVFGGKELVNAAAMLSNFRMTKEEIKAYLPAVLDLAEGYRDIDGSTISLQQSSLLIGKAFAGNITALRRMGVTFDENAYKTRGAIVVLEAIEKKFGGSAQANANTFEGQVAQLNATIGTLQASIGKELLGTVNALAKSLTVAAGAFVAVDKATGGVASGMVVATGLVIGAVYYVGMLADAWAKVAVMAGSATKAQATAGATGAAAGAAGTAGAAAAGGAFGFGKALGYGGSAAATAIGFGGAAVAAAAAFAVAVGWDYVRTRGEQEKAKEAAKSAAERQKEYEHYVPGTIRKATWGDSGANAPANPMNPTNKHLEDIKAILGDTHKAIVGGGSRTRTAINDGDVQRAIFRTLNLQVV